MKNNDSFLVFAFVRWLSVCLLTTGTSVAQVNVTDDGGRSLSVPQHWGHEAGHTAYVRHLTFTNPLIEYRLKYALCLSANEHKAEECVSLDGPTSGIGMDKPSGANWFGGGFLEINSTGDRCGLHRAEIEAKEFGSRGWVQFQWKLKDAQIRLDVMLLPEESHLYMQVSSEPLECLRAISLTCYPCGFTRSRVIRCSSGETSEKEGTTLLQEPSKTAAPFWWAYYSDPARDFAADAKSDGPCSLLVLSEDLAAVSIGNGYGVSTILRASRGRVRFALSEMPKTSNAEGLERMKAQSDVIAKKLRELFP